MPNPPTRREPDLDHARACINSGTYAFEWIEARNDSIPVMAHVALGWTLAGIAEALMVIAQNGASKK